MSTYNLNICGKMLKSKYYNELTYYTLSYYRNLNFIVDDVVIQQIIRERS